ncbi:DMT family transporter [Litorivivens sp.]|uniref:DMT family transporter n=1 Tax=Litorivivens sp. TaxID=2020868 RepID=UPI00356765A6
MCAQRLCKENNITTGNPRQFALGITLGILTVFLGSTVAAAGKHLSGQVHISAIVLAQYLICFLLVLPWWLRNGKRAIVTQRPLQHAIRGISGCACFYTYYLAMQYMPLVEATLFRNTAPLMVPMVILVWYRNAIPTSRLLPLIIGFAGVLLVLRPTIDGISPWQLVALSSGLGLAISMVSTRELARTEPESRILFYYFSISLLFVLPFFVLHYQPIPEAALPWLLYVGVVMYGTFVIYTKAFSYVPSSILAPTSYFALVFAGLLDWWIWGAVPDTPTVLGIALVISGGLLMLRSPSTAADDN